MSFFSRLQVELTSNMRLPAMTPALMVRLAHCCDNDAVLRYSCLRRSQDSDRRIEPAEDKRDIPAKADEEEVMKEFDAELVERFRRRSVQDSEAAGLSRLLSPPSPTWDFENALRGTAQGGLLDADRVATMLAEAEKKNLTLQQKCDKLEMTTARSTRLLRHSEEEQEKSKQKLEALQKEKEELTKENAALAQQLKDQGKIMDLMILTHLTV